MDEKQEKKPRNFWLEGDTPLAALPEIGKGLKLLLKKHPPLARSYQKRGMPPWKKQPGGFEGLLNIILAQQISTAAAAHMVARMKALLPEATPRRFLRLDDAALRGAGMSQPKISYARALAEDIVAGRFSPDSLAHMPEEDAMRALTARKGFGPWSAEIYLMFSLGRGDVWPAGDIALQKGLMSISRLKERPSPARARKLGEKWAPYRSAAALIVWGA